MLGKFKLELQRTKGSGSRRGARVAAGAEKCTVLVLKWWGGEGIKDGNHVKNGNGVCDSQSISSLK